MGFYFNIVTMTTTGILINFLNNLGYGDLIPIT
jgi:hypothetical protein